MNSIKKVDSQYDKDFSRDLGIGLTHATALLLEKEGIDSVSNPIADVFERTKDACSHLLEQKQEFYFRDIFKSFLDDALEGKRINSEEFELWNLKIDILAESLEQDFGKLSQNERSMAGSMLLKGNFYIPDISVENHQAEKSANWKLTGMFLGEGGKTALTVGLVWSLLKQFPVISEFVSGIELSAELYTVIFAAFTGAQVILPGIDSGRTSTLQPALGSIEDYLNSLALKSPAYTTVVRNILEQIKSVLGNPSGTARVVNYHRAVVELTSLGRKKGELSEIMNGLTNSIEDFNEAVRISPYAKILGKSFRVVQVLLLVLGLATVGMNPLVPSVLAGVFALLQTYVRIGTNAKLQSVDTSSIDELLEALEPFHQIHEKINQAVDGALTIRSDNMV